MSLSDFTAAEETKLHNSPSAAMSGSEFNSTDASLGATSSEDGEQDNLDGNEKDDIAIIGFSLRFPGEATSEEDFWKLMVEGRVTATEYPTDRLNLDAFYSPDPAALGTIRTRKSHFLKGDLGVFDADFFNFSAAEAAATDPQQRLVLETTYRALENAGIPMNEISGSNTSVHTGYFTTDFQAMVAKDVDSIPKYSATGLAGSMLSNRVSSFFDLTGPSITLDTACSSSLVALDLGCQSLRSGISDIGIVAGCSLILGPDLTIGMSNMGFLSPDGVCHSFDSRANGYSRGEGFGAVIIKPVLDAIRDGDTIRGIVRATRSNQDGRTGLAQPSKYAQRQLIDETYRSANLNRALTGYAEAHGTGTAIGDPLEAQALGAAIGAYRSPRDPLYVGSVKANIGHLEGTAGIAGLIKTILVLERAIIPAIAGLETVNREIDAKHLNLEFSRASVPWPSTGLRRASVNSFGFGGANSHAVLDDVHHYLEIRGLRAIHRTRSLPPLEKDIMRPPNIVASEHSEEIQEFRPVLLTWSAANKSSIESMTSLLASHFMARTDHKITNRFLNSLAYTLCSKRSMLDWRSSAVIKSPESLQDLQSITSPPHKLDKEVKLAFVFTGQGAQWQGMGRELMVYPVFRDSIEQALAYLRTLGCEWLVSDDFLGENTADKRIHEPRISQPVCTILQVALVDLLASLNITPIASVGHSSGEIAAAYCAGALSRESAWKVAYYRGVYSHELAIEGKGGMMAVGLSEAKVQPYLDSVNLDLGDGYLTVACVNSVSNVTISGQKSHLEYLEVELGEDKIFNRILNVQVAYHGPAMLQVASKYEQSIANLTGRKFRARGGVRMISSVTGALISEDELRTPTYWVRNMTSQVKFCQAIQNLCQSPLVQISKKVDLSHRRVIEANFLLELGPHSTLSGPIRDSLRETTNGKKVAYASVLSRKSSALDSLLEAAGKLHCHGQKLNLMGLNRVNDLSKKKPVILTDLPEYPFDHSKRYWHESRYSKSMRLREFSRNAFIGLPVADWNPLDCRWRLFLKQSDHAWITDHQVNGTVLFPAAGMLVMAIEAAQQLSQKANKVVAAYEIRDAIFHTALKLPKEDAIELQISLRKTIRLNSKRANYAEFRLFAYLSDDCVEICQGIIKTIFSDETETVLKSSLETKSMHDRAVSRFVETSSSCNTALAKSDFYGKLYSRGYHFGPSFQRLTEANYNGKGEAVGKVQTLQIGAGLPSVVHPATLDGIFHLSLLGAKNAEGGESNSTLVPTRINRLWIASSGLLPDNSAEFDTWVRAEGGGLRSTEASLVALSSNHETLKAVVEGLVLTAVTGESQDLGDIQLTLPRKLCWNMQQLPDVSSMTNSEVQNYLEKSVVATDIPDQYYDDTETMLYTYILRTMESLSLSDTKPNTLVYLEKQLAWFRDRLRHPTVELASLKPFVENDQAFEELLARVKVYGKQQSILYNLVGESFLAIFNGELDPLDLLFDQKVDELENFYRETAADCDYMRPFQSYLELLCHKNPMMKVLEVGAGTGATTSLALKFMSYKTLNGWESKYAEYAFTDVSTGFFPKAREEFEVFPKIKFAALDIERDPSEQGFEPGSYDIILAANVLHATACLSITLTNVRKLLKPGGKLILFELTTPEALWAGFVFGILPGWWLATENERQQQLSPALNEQQWDRILSENEFSGADLVLHSHQTKHMRWSSMIVATAVEKSDSQALQKEVNSVQIAQPFIQQSLRDSISTEISLLNVASHKIFFRNDLDVPFDTHTLPFDLAIVIDSVETPILVDLSPIIFEHLQYIARSTKALLWLTPCGDKIQDNSAVGAIKGFVRCIRSENPSLRFTTLFLTDYVPPEPDHGGHGKIINHALTHLLQSPDPGQIEPEMYSVGDIVHIPRVTPCLEQDRSISEYVSGSSEKMIKFVDHDVNLSIRSPGLLDSLYFSETIASANDAPLAADEIKVEVQAVGVNFKDCLVALGRVEDTTFGTECAGIITEVGTGCSRLKVGDKVIVCSLDVFRPRIHCKEALAARIPENVSMVEAAKIATNYCTAWHALVYLGRLSQGESILIHAAAGGTGQAALQIAQDIGAEIYATVGSQEKRDILTSRYGIADDHILYSRDTSFSEGIKKLTNGRGVDMILNSLAGEQLIASFECMAPYGRFLEIGKADILSHGQLPMFPFLKNVSFSAIDLAAMVRERPMMITRALVAVTELFAKGSVRTAYPLKTFQINQVEEALRYLQSGQNSGAVVVEINPETEVQAIVRRQEKSKFDPEATYVIAGGLGGQGMSIVRWMLNKQARNFLLLSRSGASSEQAASFLEELKSAGANVLAPKCDISDGNSLAEALKEAVIHLPPIKGCIQAAMVMRDAMFESMSFEEWQTATQPKIQGTWNLHSQLPAALDFFTMMSSLSCIIGSGGQSNYASGNSYQDDLARYRLARGQKAITLNLPAMSEEGYLARLVDVDQKLIDQLYNMKQLLSMSQAELFGLLDYYCNPDLSVDDLPGQLITGLDFPASVRARGLEEAPWMESPLFAHLQVVKTNASAAASGDAHSASTVDIKALVIEAESLSEAGLVVAYGIRDKLAKVATLAPDEIEIGTSLQAYGVDSLVAVELRNWFAKTVRADVTIFEIMGSASIVALGNAVAEKLRGA